MIQGFSKLQSDEVISIIDSFQQIHKVAVFGSRAMGNHKQGSDVDLAIWGESIDTNDAVKLSIKLNEYSSLPYKFDVVAFHALNDSDLKEHISKFGVIIYERR